MLLEDFTISVRPRLSCRTNSNIVRIVGDSLGCRGKSVYARW
jgi:hypothetical protein